MDPSPDRPKPAVPVQPGPTARRLNVSLQRALMLLVAVVVLAAVLPAAAVLQRRLAEALENRTREEMARAPRVAEARRAALADAMMMHAKELAGTPGLAEAVRRGDRRASVALLEEASAAFPELPLLVAADDEAWTGPAPDAPLLEATRRGEMPVAVSARTGRLAAVALAPLKVDGQVAGVVGVARLLDETEAGVLSGLSRAEVTLVAPDGTIAASTADPTVAAAAARVGRTAPQGQVLEVDAAGERWLLSTAQLGEGACVVFARSLPRELAVLPQLRRLAGFSLAGGLILALVVGALVASRLVRPVRGLADAADRLAAGDFGAPVPHSGVSEWDRLAGAFDSMRLALQARVQELERANRELRDRQERLSALQAELIQRDRLAATGRVVAQLAHEIRNPVANVRNCLELLRRRLADDPEGREFTDLAIDELLRMHELAEQMLDLNRPRTATAGRADVAAVAREVAALYRAGSPAEVSVSAPAEVPEAAVAPDALKQVLTNLVQNAQEAADGAGPIEVRVAAEGEQVVVEVLDRGPGLAPDVLPRVFDPFFTTKGAVLGVGLGLYIAEGIVRMHGGRITAGNREDGPGARFRVELPAARPAAVPAPAAAAPAGVEA